MIIEDDLTRFLKKISKSVEYTNYKGKYTITKAFVYLHFQITRNQQVQHVPFKKL